MPILAKSYSPNGDQKKPREKSRGSDGDQPNSGRNRGQKRLIESERGLSILTLALAQNGTKGEEKSLHRVREWIKETERVQKKAKIYQTEEYLCRKRSKATGRREVEREKTEGEKCRKTLGKKAYSRYGGPSIIGQEVVEDVFAQA